MFNDRPGPYLQCPLPEVDDRAATLNSLHVREVTCLVQTNVPPRFVRITRSIEAHVHVADSGPARRVHVEVRHDGRVVDEHVDATGFCRYTWSISERSSSSTHTSVFTAIASAPSARTSPIAASIGATSAIASRANAFANVFATHRQDPLRGTRDDDYLHFYGHTRLLLAPLAMPFEHRLSALRALRCLFRSRLIADDASLPECSLAVSLLTAALNAKSRLTSAQSSPEPSDSAAGWVRSSASRQGRVRGYQATW